MSCVIPEVSVFVFFTFACVNNSQLTASSSPSLSLASLSYAGETTPEVVVNVAPSTVTVLAVCLLTSRLVA